MRIDRALPLGLLAFGLSLGGCAEPLGGGLPYMGGPTNFGEANRQTMAAQIIDPAPTYPTLVPETDADHAVAAVTRYRTDKVKPPVSPRVSTSASGSGGSPQ